MGKAGVRSTTFRLLRHGAHAWGDVVLPGRSDAVGLSDAGRRQIEAVVRTDWVREIEVIHASPRRRTLETAAILSAAAGVETVTASALDEVDFGRWSGQRLVDLNADPAWHRWNTRRQLAVTPAGESYRDVQWRAWRYLCALSRRYPGSTLAVVTHAEIIRVILLAARGLPLSDWSRIEVPTASVHVLRLTAASRPAAEADGRAAP
jgi:broad specificity phosphatase PhoE